MEVDSDPERRGSGVAHPVTYADYSRDRIGWFFGLSGLRLVGLAVSALPVLVAISRRNWGSAALLLVLWVAVLLVVVVPVRGRTATGWFWTMAAWRK